VPRHEQKAARREALLDAAATLLVDEGLYRFTMEALAAAAGVSKALPYQHFGNATAVIAALYEREIGALGTSIRDATRAVEGREARISASVRAYFDLVEERGPVLVHLAGTGSPIPRTLFGQFPPAPLSLVDLVGETIDVPRSQAGVLAAIVSSIAVAASDGLARGDGSRVEMEALATTAILGTLRMVAFGDGGSMSS
jgi:AcrR family transcriptional regulator